MSESAKNIVGPTIKQLREAANLSQSALVGRLAEIGVSLSTASLSKIETRKRGVTDIELKAFSRVFNVPVEQILNDNK